MKTQTKQVSLVHVFSVPNIRRIWKEDPNTEAIPQRYLCFQVSIFPASTIFPPGERERFYPEVIQSKGSSISPPNTEQTTNGNSKNNVPIGTMRQTRAETEIN